MADILLMESEFQYAEQMRRILLHSGHQCTIAQTVADGLLQVKRMAQPVAILNARLPWKDSFSLLRTLEKRGCPVLFITADAGNMQHLEAMYQARCAVLVRPLDDKALLSALSTLLLDTNRLLTLGSLQLDIQRRQATKNGEVLSLTAQEFALLQALMQSPEAALSREQLLRTAWGYQAIGETRTVDVHIQRLRRKIGPSAIETVYKLGYRLKLA